MRGYKVPDKPRSWRRIPLVASPTQSRHPLNRVQYAVYAVTLAVSSSLPGSLPSGRTLWLDETISLFLVKDGFGGITRQEHVA